MRFQSGCLVCGQELVYLDRLEAQTCLYCGKTVESNARCKQGHFVCDACHSADAGDLIEQFCAQTDLSHPVAAPLGPVAAPLGPVAMAMTLMDHPAVAMHGPEHHFLVPAVLLAAFYRQSPTFDLSAKLKQARKRAEWVRGGFCGLCGDCGAGVGTGIFVSLVTGATPLSKKEWQLSNRMTAETLLAIAEHGGPRCCKRDTFLALQTARGFVAEHFGVTWEQEEIRCHYSAMNKECLRQQCPFYSPE